MAQVICFHVIGKLYVSAINEWQDAFIYVLNKYSLSASHVLRTVVKVDEAPDFKKHAV